MRICPKVLRLAIYKLPAVRPEFAGLFHHLAAFVVNLLHAFHDIARRVRQIAGMIGDFIRNSTRLIPRAPLPARKSDADADRGPDGDPDPDPDIRSLVVVHLRIHNSSLPQCTGAIPPTWPSGARRGAGPHTSRQRCVNHITTFADYGLAGYIVRSAYPPIDTDVGACTIQDDSKFTQRKWREMFKGRKSRTASSSEAQQGFNSSDVARICGVSLRQLQWWDERNVVSPRQDGHKRI